MCSERIDALAHVVTSDNKVVYGVNNKICKQKINHNYKGLNKQ